MELTPILEKAQTQARSLTQAEIARLLAAETDAELCAIFDAAYAVKIRNCGKQISVRGLVEVGNVCAKDCFYCGIRKSNAGVKRYHLSVGDVVRLAEETKRLGYGSLVLQSGEIESEANTAFFEEALRRIAPLGLGVTLSLGEQSEDVFRRWRAAGATRYLLRIETSNPDFYRTLHPSGHDWARRVECLRALRRCDYQVGTGVMCGLPGQTQNDLAADIRFFDEVDADMIGMGPYIPHPDTPMGHAAERNDPEKRLRLGLKMIAATRLFLHDVNIAASTALQALADDGRERGIRAGANVVMPNVTDTGYRRDYQLYEGKPALDENAETSRVALERRLAAFGETIAYGVLGDSPHFRKSGRSQAERLVRRLSEKGLTCGTAESCTGGGIGCALTDVPGASTVFRGGIISYANSVKRNVLGVSDEILNGEGPVSAACAEQMARGARELLKTDLAVSVTGLAGPGGDGVNPAGCVWFGLATASGVRTENIVFAGNRAEVRTGAVAHALRLLLAAVEN